MRSPPTAWAIEARSWSDVTTRILASAAELKLASDAKAKTTARMRFMAYLYLERMGAVGADRELELQEELVGGLVGQAEVAAPQLTPQLRELARPEGQDAGDAGVSLRVVIGVLGGLETGAREPAPGELVVAGGVPADRRLVAGRLLALAAVDLSAQEQRMIKAGLERLRAVGQVEAFQARVRVLRRAVGAEAIGEAEIQVGGVGQVHEDPVVPVVGEIAALRRLEKTFCVAAEDLQRAFGEHVSHREELGHRDAGADPPLLAAEEVDDRQRLVGPGEDVPVERVDLAEGGAHPAGLDQKLRGERGERGETFLDVDAFRAEGDEEVGARVGVDDRLDSQLGFAELRGGEVLDGVVAADREEVADHRDGGVEVIRGLRRPAGAARLGLRRGGGFGGWGFRRRWGSRLRGNRSRCLRLTGLHLGEPFLELADALLIALLQLLDLLPQGGDRILGSVCCRLGARCGRRNQ